MCVSLVFLKTLEPRVGSGFVFSSCNFQTVSIHVVVPTGKGMQQRVKLMPHYSCNPPYRNALLG
jgi:hypothetical protein